MTVLCYMHERILDKYPSNIRVHFLTRTRYAVNVSQWTGQELTDELIRLHLQAPPLDHSLDPCRTFSED